jgi:hypothetical protein
MTTESDGRLHQRGRFEQGEGFDAGGEPGNGEDGDVVVLTEGDCGGGGLSGVRPSGDEPLQTFEAEEIAGGLRASRRPSV